MTLSVTVLGKPFKRIELKGKKNMLSIFIQKDSLRGRKLSNVFSLKRLNVLAGLIPEFFSHLKNYLKKLRN